jgi:acrylyl-CoA reductase (NADPH)
MSFNAFQVSNATGTVQGRVVDLDISDLTPGDVVIKAAYSSVNYKDALAVAGMGKIIRRFPLVAGIDVAGTVVSSTDKRFVEGDAVLVTGYDLGVAHDGGYAGYARVPADWVVHVSDGLTLRETMALGTAGFTAALAVQRMEQNGLEPGQGAVAVTGATGGVGSVAVSILSKLGYDVTAITGKDAEPYLRALGASAVLSRHAIDLTPRPLEKATWAGAVDAVGGDLLAWLLRTTNYRGSVAATGLTGGVDVRTTVIPFLLRGINLLGIDSVQCPMEDRKEIWRRLATDMKPAGLDAIVTEIGLDDLPAAFETLRVGNARGRFVVRLG